MASPRTLVNSYIASARAHAPDSNVARLDWLEQKRADLSEELEGGDWEVGSTSFDGSSSTARRHATAEARFKAVMEAIDILTDDEDATKKSGGGILIPKFSSIPHG